MVLKERVGIVVSDKAQKTIVVAIQMLKQKLKTLQSL